MPRPADATACYSPSARATTYHLLTASCAEYFARIVSFIPQQPCKVGGPIPVLQRRKPKLNKVRCLCTQLFSSKFRNQTQVFLVPKPRLFPVKCLFLVFSKYLLNWCIFWILDSAFASCLLNFYAIKWFRIYKEYQRHYMMVIFDQTHVLLSRLIKAKTSCTTSCGHAQVCLLLLYQGFTKRF